MKQIILSCLLLAGTISAIAQCDKKNLISSVKTEYLNEKLELQRTEDESSTVQYDNKEIIVSPGNAPSMRGEIKSITCEWKTPYKEGKTVLKAALTGESGDAMNITLTVENKEGKISVLFEIDDRPDRKIRLVVDKFEEVK
ncbi:MAG: hypothetical protein H7Y31_09065 [Chitinophagaceae bacterium]|nr:hypothetical protein [Chitinophagaceae bacterium]